jgi:hypothetical protein
MIIKALNGIISAIQQSVILNNLVVYFSTFNENSYNKDSGATIFDISGNFLHGDITGSPVFTTNYLTFSNDNISTQNLASYLTETHTTEVWIYPTANGVVYQYNAQQTPNSAYHHSALEIVAGKVEYGLWNGSVITSTGPTSNISFNAWHQVVLTYDGTTLKGYLDGSLAGSVNVTWDSPEDASPNNLYMNFGSQDTTDQGDGTYFDGRIGIIRIYSVALSDSEVYRNYAARTGNVAALITDSLVLYYEPSNSYSYPNAGVSVFNLAPNTLTGTMSNVVDNGTYFSFNGSSSQIAIADNALLEPAGGDFSIEIWVRLSVIQTSVLIGKFDNGGASADVSYGVRCNASGLIRLEVGNGSAATSTSGYQATTGTWYQVVGVIDNTNNLMYLYINGVEHTSSAMSYTSILNTANGLYIGSYNNGEYSQYLNGDVGAVRLYSKALSGAEVLANYNNDKDRYPS